jgi:hypothetical protein
VNLYKPVSCSAIVKRKLAGAGFNDPIPVRNERKLVDQRHHLLPKGHKVDQYLMVNNPVNRLKVAGPPPREKLADTTTVSDGHLWVAHRILSLIFHGVASINSFA